MNVTPTGNALNSAIRTSVQGANAEAERFSKAANEVINGFAEAANAVSDTTNEVSQTKESLSSETFLASTGADPLQGIIDMKLSETAFKANLEAFKTADEMVEHLLDVVS